MRHFLLIFCVLLAASINTRAQSATENYLSGLGAASLPEEFDKAAALAENSKDRRMALEYKEYWTREHRRERWSTVTLKNFFNLGLGLEYEMWHNLGYGPRLECRFGTDWQLINGAIGIKVLSYNNIGKDLYKRDMVSYTAIPFFADARVNLYSSDHIGVHADAELAFTLVTNEIYHNGIDIYDTNKELGNHHFTTSIRIGTRIDNIDMGIYVKYDTKPVLNQKYIYETIGYDYYAFGKAINERVRIGASIILRIKM